MSERLWLKNPDLAVVDDDERVVVLRLDDLAEPPRILDGTAVPVWNAIDGHRTRAEIVELVAEGFDIEPSIIASDVRRFLDALASLGLVLLEEPGEHR